VKTIIYNDRLKKLRQELSETDLPALLVSRPENRRYLSGFTAEDPQLDESSGCLLITRRRQFLLTDFRYAVQARKEAADFEIEVYWQGQAQDVGRLVKRFRLRRLGFEENHLTVQAHRLLVKEIGRKTEMIAAPGLVEKMRAVKDPGEIRLITQALRITEKSLQQTLAFMQSGRTESETAEFLEKTMVKLGAEGPAFPSIVASGPNAALPHAVPGRRKIKDGETIVIDCGAKYQGYCADLSRTIVLGRVRPWIREIYRLVRRAQVEAIRGLRPGLNSDQADALAREIIEAGGYGPQFGHALGHGVGLATHEAPSLSRFRPAPLEPGMVVTVEPGIYLEGRGGVRLEEMVLITEKGARLLNRDKHFYDWTENRPRQLLFEKRKKLG